MLRALLRKGGSRLGLGVLSLALFLNPARLMAQNAKPNFVVIVLDQLRADELH